MDFPFQQYIKEGKMVRVFTTDAPADELKLLDGEIRLSQL